MRAAERPPIRSWRSPAPGSSACCSTNSGARLLLRQPEVSGSAADEEHGPKKRALYFHIQLSNSDPAARVLATRPASEALLCELPTEGGGRRECRATASPM